MMRLDALGAPVCPPGTVVADVGADQVGIVGQDICFNASNSTGTGLSFSWDLDGDKEIDTIGEEVCITCTEVADGEVTVFVTEVCDCSVAGSTCACVDSDTALFSCTDNRPLCLGEPPTDGCTFIVDGIEVPDQPCIGTPKRDVIFGTDGPDVISGLGGNDIIKGRGGDDSCAGMPVTTISMVTMTTIRSTAAMVVTICRAIRDLTRASMERTSKKAVT